MFIARRNKNRAQFSELDFKGDVIKNTAGYQGRYIFILLLCCTEFFKINILVYCVRVLLTRFVIITIIYIRKAERSFVKSLVTCILIYLRLHALTCKRLLSVINDR